MKKVAIIFVLFLLSTGLMLFKKGLLTRESIDYLKGKILPSSKESLSEASSQKSIKASAEEEEIVQALKDIEDRKKAITQREEELDKLKEHLMLQEKELSERADELVLLKKEIEGYFHKAESERDSRVKWLAQVYNNMRAEEVAPILQKLEDDLALEVLSRMDERQVGKILGMMDVQKAAKLAQKIGKKLPGRK